MVRSRQELCSPGGLRQGCEILEDREGGPGGGSVQETVWKSGSSREGGTAFLSVHFKSDDYDIMYNTNNSYFIHTELHTKIQFGRK